VGLVETDGGGIASVEYRGFIVDSNLTFAAEKVINLLTPLPVQPSETLGGTRR
jgi:hypothetical protein